MNINADMLTGGSKPESFPTGLWKYFFVVAFVAPVMIYAYGRISYENPRYAAWDLHDYRAMAQASPNLTTEVRRPFVYRILGPYFAGLLPINTDTGFLVLTVTLGLLLPWLLYFFMCAAGTTPRISAVVTTLFVLNKYLYGFAIWNYFQVDDLLSQVELILLFWAITERAWPAFGVVLFFGALTKELSLLLVPTTLVFLIETASIKKEWRGFLTAALPACAAALALRIALHASTGNNLTQAFGSYAGKLREPEAWFRLLINAFIPFSLVPIIFFQSTRTYFRTKKYALVFAALVLISTLFGLNNERLMAPAFIVFYPLLAFIIDEQMAMRVTAVPVLIGMAMLASLHHEYTRFLLTRGITIVCSLGALCVVSLTTMYYKMKDEAG